MKILTLSTVKFYTFPGFIYIIFVFSIQLKSLKRFWLTSNPGPSIAESDFATIIALPFKQPPFHITFWCRLVVLSSARSGFECVTQLIKQAYGSLIVGFKFKLEAPNEIYSKKFSPNWPISVGQ